MAATAVRSYEVAMAVAATTLATTMAAALATGMAARLAATSTRAHPASASGVLSAVSRVPG